MKFLGTNSGSRLDSVENVTHYSDYILRTGSTLLALQEIGATHSVGGQPKCYYLDLIVDELNNGNSKSASRWAYVLDAINRNQRLAFLYKQDEWDLISYESIEVGTSFNYIRKPFLARVKAVGENSGLTFDFINIHLKAFPDNSDKRKQNMEELASWIKSSTLDDDVLISGDTNIYLGEMDTDKPLTDIGYIAFYDNEKTAIHESRMSQKFDRFYSSPGLNYEIESAKRLIGKEFYIDVIRDGDDSDVVWFDDNISDHYPVVINVDISREK